MRVHELNTRAAHSRAKSFTSMSKQWTNFVATLQEMQPHPFGNFAPAPVPCPKCPYTVQVFGTLHYKYDGSNMFLGQEAPRPDDVEPLHHVDVKKIPWLRTVRDAPVRTPLGCRWCSDGRCSG